MCLDNPLLQLKLHLHGVLCRDRELEESELREKLKQVGAGGYENSTFILSFCVLKFSPSVP